NAYRMQVVQAIAQFDQAIRKEKTVQDKCITIYQLLDNLSIPRQLEAARFKFDEAGQIEKGREEEQVWDGVMQLLDEFVEMVGDDVMSFTSFQQILEAGLEALEFSHVPPTMDHIIVASIDQSRIETKKAAFLLGVNEGTWPLRPPLGGMINEREREFLKQFGMELAESSRRVLLDDNTRRLLSANSIPNCFRNSRSRSLIIPPKGGLSGQVPSFTPSKKAAFFVSILDWSIEATIMWSIVGGTCENSSASNPASRIC